MKGFEKFQNVFGAMKAAAVVMFIVVAAILMIKGMNSEPKQVDGIIANFQGFFSEGVKGVWLGLLYAFFAFGGIEVMGLLVIDLKDPQQAPKAGKVMIVILTTIYVIALVCALALVYWASFTIDESPFITALANFNIPFVADIITGILIIAGFSTMVASLYAVVTILTALAEDHDAPALLAKKEK